MSRPRPAPRTASARGLLRLAAIALLLAGAGALAQGLSEQQVKAAFLYNFTKFVQWPAEAFAAPQSPLVLCIPGREPLAGGLDSVQGNTVQGRELRIRRAIRPDEVKACHVLFVPEAQEAGANELLRASRTLPVLTVGEVEGFAQAGGIVGFVSRDDRIQFEINPDAAARANLRISSQLLRLAIIARDDRRARP